MAGIGGGALASLGLVVAFMGIRQRRASLAVAGVLMLLAAALLVLGLLAAPWAALLLLPSLALTLWLTHRALRALAAGRGQQAELLQRLAGRDAELEQARAQLQQAQAGAEAADQA